jgi:TP901 family phage tail tape measure protein
VDATAVDIAALLTANIDDFKAKMAEADVSAKAMTDSGTSNFSKLSSIGQGLLLGLGAVAVGVGGVAVDLALKYQTTTAQIAANAGISVAAATKISSAFLDTAGKTIYSGQQIATAYAAVAGQLGSTQGHALDAAQAMTVMDAAMDLAEATGSSLTSTTADLAGVMQAYKIKASGAAEASDILFNSARLTATSVDTVSAMVDKLAATLGAVTPPLKDAAGLMYALAEAHETGRKAISAVSTAYTGLLNPTAAVTYAQDLLGVKTTAANGTFVGMGNIITQLQPILAAHGQMQDLAILKAIGLGSANSKLLDIILSGPNAYAQDIAAVGKANSAHAAAEEQAKTLTAQFEIVKAAVQDYATELGQRLIPVIEQLITDTKDVVDWFEQHKVVAEALAAVIGTVLVAAIGAYIISVGVAAVEATQKAISGVTQLATRMGILSASTDENNAATATNTAGKEANAAATEASAAATTESEGATVGASASLGPYAIAIGVVVAGAVALSNAINGGTSALLNQLRAAQAMSQDTAPELTLKIAALTAQEDAWAKKTNEAGMAGQIATKAYDGLQAQIKTLQQGQTEYNSNLTLLSSTFGVNKTQASALAQELGLNLTAALSPAMIIAFSQQLQISGDVADGTKAKISGLATLTQAQAVAMVSSFSGKDWYGLGESIPAGIAAGITAGQFAPIQAVQNTVAQAIAAAQAAAGTHSPSTLFAALVGLPIAQGIAEGITGGSGLPSAAVRALIGSAASAGVTSYASSVAAGSSTATTSGSGGGTLQVNLAVDGQQFAQAMLPFNWQAMLQQKRSAVTLNLT